MKTLILFIFLSLQVFAQSELLTLFADGYLPETESFKSRVTINGGTISAATLKAVDEFVKDVSTIRTKLLRVNLICGNDTAAMKTPLFYNTNGSATPVGYASDYLVGIVPADYTQAAGLQCSTAPKLMVTGVAPNATDYIGTNDVHASIYIGSNQQTAASILGGGNTLLYPRYTNNTTLYRLNTGSSVNAGASTNSIGYWVLSRNASDSSSIFKNGTLIVKSASASATEPNRFIIGGSDASTGGAVLVRGYTVGLYLTSSQQALLNTAIEKFNDALGRGVQ